ncbi:MAG: plasmid pRiA4b ORF-3 family protein [Acidobacteria bacterium]|nr:plasmid pRiA4b ORF-3 family protein [Acidobacteriota bacterium]
MTTKKVKAIFQLKVSLRDIEPSIWRSVQVAEDTKLPRLHRVLQLLFNWENYHLHDFIVGRRVYSVPDPDDAFNERKVIDERHVPLNRIVDRVGDSFEYVYDFGDDWRHDVLLEAILLPSPDVFYPRCIAGARNGPPEDAGGPGGYADYLEALADPDHEEHENMLAWRGAFDPEAFSIEAINASLKRTFYRRAPGKKAAEPAAADRDIDELTKFMLAALQGQPTPEMPRTRIAPGTTLPLELTDRERELILKHSFAPDELTRQLRIVPQPGKPAVARYTLGDLDDLAGYVAAESNHAKNRKLHKEWEGIFVKIAAILESYTDEEQ